MTRVQNAHLFRFTPSLMEPDTLERMLVQRAALAGRLTDLIRDSALTPNKHHTLLIGPRGIGKTHLIALTYHRVKAMDDLRDKMWIAWLNEEEWGIESFLDLLLRICRALQSEYPAQFPADRVEALYQQTPDKAQRMAEELLKEFVGSRTLVLLMENLDDVFKGMGDKGQRQWRAFLQNNTFSAITATSQGLFNGVSRENSPFYGFFRVQHLPEFDVDDAAHLLKNIALLKRDHELVRFIETPSGRARVRAMNLLAGGNPRVYVIFSEFLTRDTLDELVEPFLSTLDELTPYYQARISALSTQQRKIVEFLCQNAIPATVKEIAKRCFISQQTASGQLKDLKEKGYVMPDPVGPTGRDTYYELKEPLMRLSLEVKNSRTGPIRLLVDFLRLWYPIAELRQQLDLCQPEETVERTYLQQAIRAAEETDDPRVKACRDAYKVFLSAAKFQEALGVADELLAIRADADAYISRGASLLLLDRSQEALDSLNTALQMDASSSAAWYYQSAAFNRLDCYEEAIASAEQSVKFSPENSEYWLHFAELYSQEAQFDDAIETLDRALAAVPKSVELWLERGRMLEQLEYLQEALVSYAKAAKNAPGSIDSWIKQAFMLRKLNRLEEAMQCYDKAIRHNSQNGLLWYARGTLFLELHQYEQALVHFDKAVQLDAKADCAYYDGAISSVFATSFSVGLQRLEDALVQHPIDGEHLTFHTRILMDAMLSNPQPQSWPAQIQSLVELYDRHNAVRALPPASLQSLTTCVGQNVSNHAAQTWYESWKCAGSDLPEFALVLRVLNVAVRYKATRDERVLLELATEERRILKSLLPLQQHTVSRADKNNQARNDETPTLSDEV